MQKKWLALACAALVVAACSENPTSSNPEPGLAVVRAPGAQVVPGRYIVLFKPVVADVKGEAGRIVSGERGRMLFTYEHAVRGFAADLSDAAVQRLRTNPNVALIEADQVVHLDGVQAPTPSWGLDRIDQRNLPLNNSYTYPTTGAGVHFYGIDTGILGGINGAAGAHVDVAGRLSTGFDAVTAGGNANDCNGHGTHTATTAAGATYGVAKAATLHPVRVLDCTGSGTFAGVVAGINWVTADHQAHPGQNSVANMSLGGGPDPATDAAVQGSIAAGVTYAISAGNSTTNACNQSPARVPEAITVMAFNINDHLANFSNFGPCTDIGGPGVNITAGWIGSTTATNTISGTSMSSPHVAGAAILYLAANPGATPLAVRNALVNNGTAGILHGVGAAAYPANTPNVNLYIGFIGGGGGNQPPVAAFTSSCNNTTRVCTFNGSGSTDDVGIVSYSWNFGDGSPAGSGVSPSHTYATTGTFQVTLTVTDGGALTNAVTHPVTLSTGTNQPPVAAWTVSCQPAPAHVCTVDGTGSNDPDGTIVSYKWTNKGGTVQGTTATFTKTFAATTSVTWTLTVTDNGGKTGKLTKTFSVP